MNYKRILEISNDQDRLELLLKNDEIKKIKKMKKEF